MPALFLSNTYTHQCIIMMQVTHGASSVSLVRSRMSSCHLLIAVFNHLPIQSTCRWGERIRPDHSFVYFCVQVYLSNLPIPINYMLEEVLERDAQERDVIVF